MKVVDFVKAEIIKFQIQSGLGTEPMYKVKTSNASKGRLELRCVEALNNKSSCKFAVNFKFKDNTATVTSSDTTHSCTSDSIIPGAIIEKKGRKRNVSISVVRAGNPAVNDFTAAHGAKRAPATLLLTSSRNPQLPALSKNQAAMYAAKQNRPDNSPRSCIYEYAKLASFFLKMQDHDPAGTYKLGFAKHKYTGRSDEESELLKEIPGSGYAVAFAFYYVSMSATNNSSATWLKSRRIVAFDGAHMFSPFKGTLYEFRGLSSDNDEVTLAWGVSSLRENKEHSNIMLDAFLKDYRQSLRFMISDCGSSFSAKRKEMNSDAARAYQNRDNVILNTANAPMDNAIEYSQNPDDVFAVGHSPLWLLDTYHLGKNARCGSGGQELVKKLALATNADEFKSIIECIETECGKFTATYLKKLEEKYAFHRMQNNCGLLMNYDTTSSNAAEHANSALREMRGIAILSGAINHIEKNMNSLRKLREKHARLLNDGTTVSPKRTKIVLAMCLELQEGLWERSFLSSISNNGHVGVLCQARHKDRTGFVFNVRFFPDAPQEKRIDCVCGHYLRAGAPCQHAAFFLVGYKEILGLHWADPYWYHPTWHIRPVLNEQPSFPENLTEYPLYRVLPPYLTPTRHGKIKKIRRKKRPEDVATSMRGNSSAAAGLGLHLTNTAPQTGVFPAEANTSLLTPAAAPAPAPAPAPADNSSSGLFPPPAVPGPAHAVDGTSEVAHVGRKRRTCNKCGARHDDSACIFFDHNYIVHRADNISTFMEVLRAPVLPPEVISRLLHGKRSEAVGAITFDMVSIVDEGDASDAESNENDVDDASDAESNENDVDGDDNGNEGTYAAGGGPPLLAPGEDSTQPQQVEHDLISDDTETADTQAAAEFISSTRSHLMRARRPPSSLLE